MHVSDKRRVTLLPHVCNKTHSFFLFWKETYVSMSKEMHISDKRRVIWLTHGRNKTHSFVQHDSFTTHKPAGTKGSSWMRMCPVAKCVTWPIYVCEMTYSCAVLLVHMCSMPHSQHAHTPAGKRRSSWMRTCSVTTGFWARISRPISSANILRRIASNAGAPRIICVTWLIYVLCNMTHVSHLTPLRLELCVWHDFLRNMTHASHLTPARLELFVWLIDICVTWLIYRIWCQRA